MSPRSDVLTLARRLQEDARAAGHRRLLVLAGDALASLVASRRAAGDCHLHLVRGEDLTTLADLTDGAHFSVAGAAQFAGSLSGWIGPPWGDTNDDGAWTAQDWPGLADCLTGPGLSPPPGTCEGLDLDCDLDVDLAELAAFQRRVRP